MRRFSKSLLLCLFAASTSASYHEAYACQGEHSQTSRLMDKLCREGGYVFHDQLTELVPEYKAARSYLIYNRTSNPILLDHPVAHPSTSAGWGSKLDGEHWSIFAVNRANFTLSCGRQTASGKIDWIACEDVISVCQLKKGLTENQEATFWQLENKSNAELLNYLNGKLE